MDYYSQATKKSKVSVISLDKYIGLSKLPCGSVRAERAFSHSGIFMQDQRRSTDPITLECLMMLSSNNSLWGIDSLRIVDDDSINE